LVKGLPFALGSGMEIRDRAMKYLYLLLRDIMWLHKTHQTLSMGFLGGATKLETMILLPWSNTLVVSTAGAAAVVAAFPDVAGLLLVVCLGAEFASALFTRRPRLPLRMPRLRGLAEMMSNIVRGWGIKGEDTIKRLIERSHIGGIDLDGWLVR
jgi:hypothetical protein